MFNRPDIVYLYDGSFDGFLCCIFESYTCKENPLAIFPFDTVQENLYNKKQIETDFSHSDRVYASIRKMGTDVERLIETAFLCDIAEKEIAIFRFIRLAYKVGGGAYNMLQNEFVAQTHAMAKAVNNEKHLLLGFVRFAEYHGGLVSVIEPKHIVLPLMKGHFCSRFPEEHFLIFDKTHKMALFYQPYKAVIVPIDNIEPPQPTKEEMSFQALWAGYFNAIAIKERENPKCQMGHMPKRFWQHMVETQMSAKAIESARSDIKNQEQLID